MIEINEKFIHMPIVIKLFTKICFGINMKIEENNKNIVQYLLINY